MPVSELVAAQMLRKHHEEIVATGKVPQGAVFVAASRTGSFTIILKRNSGMTCIAASGEGWDHEPVQPGQYF